MLTRAHAVTGRGRPWDLSGETSHSAQHRRNQRSRRGENNQPWSGNNTSCGRWWITCNRSVTVPVLVITVCYSVLWMGFWPLVLLFCEMISWGISRLVWWRQIYFWIIVFMGETPGHRRIGVRWWTVEEFCLQCLINTAGLLSLHFLSACTQNVMLCQYGRANVKPPLLYGFSSG